jgi:beta-lactamase class D
MKQIKPIQIWDKGTLKNAEFLQVTGINDNYESFATNYWQLFTKMINTEGIESPGEQVAQGNTTISGADYNAWCDVPSMSVNDWIYNWNAEQINVTIMP